MHFLVLLLALFPNTSEQKKKGRTGSCLTKIPVTSLYPQGLPWLRLQRARSSVSLGKRQEPGRKFLTAFFHDDQTSALPAEGTC